MLVEEGEVGGHNDPLRSDGPPIGDRPAGDQPQHSGAFIYLQPLHCPGGKLQRVELGLVGKADCSHGGEGERRGGDEAGGCAHLLQGGQLSLQPVPAGPGIDVSVPFFKVAVDLPAQGPVPLQSLQVGPQVQPGALQPQDLDHFAAEQPVLGGELGGGVSGGAGAQPIRLCQGTVDARPVEQHGGQDARHTAADDQHIHMQRMVQGGKLGQGGGFLP